jgi:cardiolipin synthase A/B
MAPSPPGFSFVAPSPVSETPPRSVELLNGGAEAFPRMLAAIRGANRRIHLEVYGFERDEIGVQFLEALQAAARRGVRVRVVIDGWGSMLAAGQIVGALRSGGCEARVYNPLAYLFLGRSWRNHRKILLVDDQLAYVGGINIGDVYVDPETGGGWADIVVEIRGAACSVLVKRIWGDRLAAPSGTNVRVLIPGLGGGRQLRRRYVKSIGRARESVSLAHAYFLPDHRLVRSLTAAARRGVQVVLLLSGRSDVPLARAATRRLYRKLLSAGIQIFEWTESVLHAKALVVDERRMLIGSFNLDPLSLVNLEILVDVEDPAIAVKGDAWIADHCKRSREITAQAVAGPALRVWLVDVLGLLVGAFARVLARWLAPRRLSK